LKDKDKNKIVEEHIQQQTIHTVMIVPSHNERGYDETFEKAKDTLKRDGFLDNCWLCGSNKNLQVHHWWAEWCENRIIDLKILKLMCDSFDIYGYSKKLYDVPITEISDIRQLMTLCQEHHTGTDSTNNNSPTGIHQLPFNEWILQKVAVISPIPQEGFTLKQTEERIENYLEKEVK
jgi:hypothetical protein